MRNVKEKIEAGAFRNPSLVLSGISLSLMRLVLEAGGRDQISPGGRFSFPGPEECSPRKTRQRGSARLREPKRMPSPPLPPPSVPSGMDGALAQKHRVRSPRRGAGPLTLPSSGPPAGPGLGRRHTAASWEGNGKVRTDGKTGRTQKPHTRGLTPVLLSALPSSIRHQLPLE